MDTIKIRDRWKTEERHEDTTLDYAICEIYTLCAKVDQLQAELDAIKQLCSNYNEFGKVFDENVIPPLATDVLSIISELQAQIKELEAFCNATESERNVKLQADIVKLKNATEAVVWDTENQDQSPINDHYAVICDTTVNLCKQFLK